MSKTYPCPDCSNPISRAAISCPRCGRFLIFDSCLAKFFMYIGFAIMLGVVVVIVRVC